MFRHEIEQNLATEFPQEREDQVVIDIPSGGVNEGEREAVANVVACCLDLPKVVLECTGKHLDVKIRLGCGERLQFREGFGIPLAEPKSYFEVRVTKFRKDALDISECLQRQGKRRVRMGLIVRILPWTGEAINEIEDRRTPLKQL